MHIGMMNADDDALYVAPALTVLGSVAELTMACDKTYGSTDGFTFQGQGVVCRSS
jgi:hypothetical protein